MMRGAASLLRIARLSVAGVLLAACCAGAAGVEINAATRAQLEQLDGIGVALAERILVERERSPFTGWDDLQRRVKGLRGPRLERLKGQRVTVNGIPASRATPPPDGRTR